VLGLFVRLVSVGQLFVWITSGVRHIPGRLERELVVLSSLGINLVQKPLLVLLVVVVRMFLNNSNNNQNIKEKFSNGNVYKHSELKVYLIQIGNTCHLCILMHNYTKRNRFD
jgi:hypothetical protein